MGQRSFRSTGMLLTAICVQVISVFGLSAAHALPPSKANLCMSLIPLVRSAAPFQDSGDTTYTLKSIDSIRRNSFTYEAVQPSVVSEGYYLSANSQNKGARRKSSVERSSSGFGRVKVAERLEGIVHFSQGAELSDGQQGKILSATLRGEPQIAKFLSDFRGFLYYSEKISSAQLREIYLELGLVATTSSAGALIGYLPSAIESLQSGNPGSFVALISALFVGNVAMTTDAWLKRPLAWDWNFVKQLSRLEKGLLQNKDMVGVLSRNVTLGADVQDGLMNYRQSEGAFQANIERQALLDQTPLLPLMILPEEKMQKKWVGMDLIFERSEGKEPELHLVIRSSEKRPEFPKLEKAPEAKAQTELELVPALAPIRHR